MINHSDKIKIRNLEWANVGRKGWDNLLLNKPTSIPPKWADLSLNSEINYDYISYHWHKRG